jgi:hypothetical protein
MYLFFFVNLLHLYMKQMLYDLIIRVFIQDFYYVIYGKK